MTKRELIEALEPFDDEIPIMIFKNGVVFLAHPYYHLTKDGSGTIVIHNLKPDLPKTTGLI